MKPLSFRLLAPVLLLLVCALTFAVYYPGLSGAFLFDDVVHVKANNLIMIENFSLPELSRAWLSSPFNFPASRPLSMLSFGINHALTGMDPFYFKLTNLLIHLLAGLGVFVLAKLIGSTYSQARNIGLSDAAIQGWALSVTALWLLSPLNLSPVLYVVQRMTSLSALFSILALICYVSGRRRMLGGGSGIPRVLVGLLVFGPLAFLAKENAALLPAFMLLLEFTLFRFKAVRRADRHFLTGLYMVTILLPLVLGTAYLIQHPQWITGGYARRGFDLSERLMTEGRILWFYLHMTFVPDIAAMGLYHDDLRISRGLLDPPSTLLALLGIAGLLLLAILVRSRAPILAFGILFFFAGHLLESTAIALELIYEHRNYLPSFGLLLALSYYLVASPESERLRKPATAAVIVLVGIFAANTAMRAFSWRDELNFVAAEQEHHPDSPRANFHMAQLLISTLRTSPNPAEQYQTARVLLEHTVELSPGNADALFGLIVLNLHVNKPVPRKWLDQLKYRLEFVPYTPENISTSQFSYIIRWHLSQGAPKLPSKEVLEIFQAVFRNPTLDKYAKAGISSALRAYYQTELEDLETALRYAYQAVDTWPERWSYQDRLIKLLVDMHRYEEAEKRLGMARQADKDGVNEQAATQLEQLIEAAVDPRQRDPRMGK